MPSALPIRPSRQLSHSFVFSLPISVLSSFFLLRPRPWGDPPCLALAWGLDVPPDLGLRLALKLPVHLVPEQVVRRFVQSLRYVQPQLAAKLGVVRLRAGHLAQQVRHGPQDAHGLQQVRALIRELPAQGVALPLAQVGHGAGSGAAQVRNELLGVVGDDGEVSHGWSPWRARSMASARIRLSASGRLYSAMSRITSSAVIGGGSCVLLLLCMDMTLGINAQHVNAQKHRRKYSTHGLEGLAGAGYCVFGQW